MANVKQSLTSVMGLGGAIAAALVDLDSGMTLGTVGGGDDFNIEVAAAANTEVVRGELAAIEALGLQTEIEDILVTLGTQYHVVRPIAAAGGRLFLYAALDKTKANLAMSRLTIAQIARGLTL